MGDYTDSPTQSADSTLTASASAVPNVPVSNPPADPSSDSNRPDSTILADSLQATDSAQPKPADSQTQPVSEPKLQPNQVFEGSASAEIIPSADSTVSASGPADLQPTVPISPQSPESPQSFATPAPAAMPAQPEPQPSSVSAPSELPKENSIQDHPPSNQPPQVQPEALGIYQ